MYRVWYQYKDRDPEVLEDEIETVDEAQHLLDEHTLAYGSNMGDISMWIELVE